MFSDLLFCLGIFRCFLTCYNVFGIVGVFSCWWAFFRFALAFVIFVLFSEL